MMQAIQCLGCICFCLLLSADHCRYIPRLLGQSYERHSTPSDLFVASVNGSHSGLALLGNYAEQTADQHWLKITAQLGIANSYYHLALLQTDPQAHLDYLRLAAQSGHAESQFELFLSAKSPSQKLMWLKRSAASHYQPAFVALYQWHMLRGRNQQAQPYLVQAAKFDGASALVLARQLWRQGHYSSALQEFASALKLGNLQASHYLHHIHWFGQHIVKSAPVAQAKPESVLREACVMQLQFVSTSIDGVMKASQFIQNFNSDKRLLDLPICVEQPLWVEPEHLKCQNQSSSSGRLSCDLLQLSRIVAGVNFTHLAVIGDSGKANVDNGIMYLDLADDYNVFIHELAHFVGFVDEYPLTAQMAKQVCDGQGAPNLVFVRDDSDVQDPMLSQYMFGQQRPLTPARTCLNHPNHAFKATEETTFMEFHDYGVIPEFYIEQWYKLLQSPQNLIPAAINFSQHFDSITDLENAVIWKQQAQKFYRN